MKWRFALIGLIAATAVAVTTVNLPAQQTQPAAGYKIDGTHSMVIFGVGHMGVSKIYGRFNDVSGAFEWSDTNLRDSAIQMTVKAGSVDTANAQRDQHLASPDFFDAKRHPTITFVSRSIRAAGDGGFEVTGDLALHGVTHSITVPLRKIGEGPGRGGAHLIGLEARFSIKRSDYGMTNMIGPAGDEVELIVSLEGVRR